MSRPTEPAAGTREACGSVMWLCYRFLLTQGHLVCPCPKPTTATRVAWGLMLFSWQKLWVVLGFRGRGESSLNPSLERS